MLVTGVIASGASSGKRSVQKRWSARGRKGSTAARHSASLSRVGIWKIVGASSGSSFCAIAASAAAAWVVRLIARVERSPHPSAEAKASTTASTRASLCSALPPNSKRFQPG